nr:alanine/glycine:cation symporter family protein [uncultured Tyzzerella sp.]
MNSFMESFSSVIGSVGDFLYTWILAALLIITGLYFSFKTGFVQIRLLPEALKVILEKKPGKGVSSFQALMISTASRVGTGNIIGVALAIGTGGPGAVFWMWLLAIIGSASAFIESTLAQVYKVKDENGFRGGPAYYIQNALKSRPFGILFSIFLIACFAFGFNALQAFNVGDSLKYYFPNYSDSIIPVLIGFVLATLTGLTIYGGVKRIGFITSGLVPIMALIYIALGLFVTIKNINLLPSVFKSIFTEAFNFDAIFGGGIGAFTSSCVMQGIKRGLFSNEAGMGSAPNAAATADVSHPVKQGLVQMFSVFIDTIFICSTTAMILLCSGVSEGRGMEFVQNAVKANVGQFGIHFISVAVFLFAFSSLVGNYYYAEANIKFIKDDKVVLNIFRICCLIMIFFGTQLSLEAAWNLADLLMGFMAIVNIVAILLLGNVAIKCLKDYIKQKKEGKEPVFKAKDIGLDNTECWK